MRSCFVQTHEIANYVYFIVKLKTSALVEALNHITENVTYWKLNMKTAYRHIALYSLSTFLMQSDRALSETGESQGSVAGFGMAKLSGGGMIAMIVLGIFGVALLAVICCASWSMIMTCFELRDRDKTSESLEEPRKSVDGKTLFTSSVFRHPLASDGPVDSTESVV